MAPMADSTPVREPRSLRQLALIGLAGSILSGIGDVLILGRPCSGREFDRAAGMVPRHIDADNRWRSLWNGAAFPVHRIRAGAVTGFVGIGLLQRLAMRGISRAIPLSPERTVAATSATAFALSGVITHHYCASVILAYQQAARAPLQADEKARRAPPSGTRPLAVSAAASLIALALFSASLTVAALRRRASTPPAWSTVTPFPCVMATLLTFGTLPAPVGGYARPASISIGLTAYFAVTAASAGPARTAP